MTAAKPYRTSGPASDAVVIGDKGAAAGHMHDSPVVIRETFDLRNMTNQDARSRCTVEKYVRAARTHACVDCVRPQLFFQSESSSFFRSSKTEFL
jgi:hypothetical protein